MRRHTTVAYTTAGNEPRSSEVGQHAVANPLRRFVLATALLLVLSADETASARLRKLSVDIAAGIASVTLGELVRQTGLQVLFEADAIQDHRTRAVSGHFDADEALRVMLEGSGLAFEFINERTVTVHPRPASPVEST